ncbi:MAG: hypothetical protein JXB34_04060 [Bacteroidales bacterium]|nr:hypothetical protein [Bacteroidales bacterium]
MKPIIVMILALLPAALFSQDNDEFKTIFSGREMGGYGAFSLGYTIVDTSQSAMFSGRGGVILGHTLALGIGGSSFITEYQYNSNLNLKGSMAGGYGGFFLELIIAGKSPVHLSVPCLFGVGGAAYTTWVNEGEDYERINYVEDVTTFLIIEPGAELEFNLTKHFRMAAFVNYRLTSNLNLTATGSGGETIKLASPSALNGYSAGLIFKFGIF